MDFVDNEHELFFVNKIKQLYKLNRNDPYYISIIYSLGICETTRNSFEKIFNMRKGKINVDAINEKWQTDTSCKVTRLAFSLWNGCMYDSKEDYKNQKMSKNYNISEIFSFDYSPYLYNEIILRYT